MAQVLVCAHPWELIQAEQTPFDQEPIPAIYKCPVCKVLKSEGQADPKVVLGRIIEA